MGGRIKKDTVGITRIEDLVQQFLSPKINANGCERLKGSHLREPSLNEI